MSGTFTRRLARLIAASAACILAAMPASSCPVASPDGEYDLATMDLSKFSPLITTRIDDAPARAQRAMAETACEGGFAGPYPCNNVDLLAFMPLGDIGGGEGNDIWGWTDPQTGKEYAIMGRTSGTSFVDISDPVNPVYLGNLPTHTSNSGWRDMKVHANHAFIVSEASGHGMQIFDLTQLRDVTSPPETFVNTAHYGLFGNAHNIAINEETAFAYAVGTSTCSGGLHMVDISDPVNPVNAGCYSADGYTHDTQCVVFQGPAHRFHHGSELCFNSNEDTLTIVDVTDKATPVQLARLPYAQSGYTHQGWLTEDHRYFILDDELDEQSFGHNTRTRVFDVSDPANPSLIGTYDSVAAAIDHNLYVRGEYAFQANYRAGLRILDASDVANGVLTEEAYFDIYPSSDAPNFNGAWSNYPYFDSGVVIVSGIEQGLFVLRPTSLVATFRIGGDDELLEVCGAGSDSLSLDVTGLGGFTDEVALNVTGVPAGASASLNPAALTPPGIATLTVNVDAPVAGQYMLSVDGVAGEIGYSAAVNLDVSLQAPIGTAPVLPTNGASGVSSNQTLYWDGSGGAYRYDLQIATDAAFADIVVDAQGLTLPSYAAAGLPDGVPLFWRVVSHNACGSVQSDVYTFTTAAASCALVESVDVPLAIDSGPPNAVTSVLNASLGGQIVDVNVVDLNGSHTYLGDLDFQLEGPIVNAHGGRTNSRHAERALVRIIERTCGSLNDFQLSLDDDAPAGALPCPYNDGGTYRPANPMTPFLGNPGTGEWRLTVTDNANIDGGSLQGWGLEICTTPLPASLDSDGDGIADNADNCIDVANPDQRDTHGDGYGNICDPDLDNNGVVNTVDLGLLRAAFFATGPGLDADFNGDELVNTLDLGILKAYFFGPPGPSGVATQ